MRIWRHYEQNHIAIDDIKYEYIRSLLPKNRIWRHYEQFHIATDDIKYIRRVKVFIVYTYVPRESKNVSTEAKIIFFTTYLNKNRVHLKRKEVNVGNDFSIFVLTGKIRGSLRFAYGVFELVLFRIIHF